MFNDDSDLLFSTGDLAAYLRHRPSTTPLVLDLANMRATSTPATVTVPGVRDYFKSAKGPTQQPGHQLSVVIPFTGDPELWFAWPAGIGRGMGLQPRGVVDAEQNTLTLTFAHTDDPTSNWYVRKHQEMLDRIKVFLINQANQLG